MPKPWNETIQAHRVAVRDAILETTAELVAEHGLLSVTMSRIAEETGIGRATLYKYFPDVEAILLAYHQRLVDGHLSQLAALRDRPGPPEQRLKAVLVMFALISYHRAQHGVPELGALLHRGEHVAAAQEQLTDLIRDLLVEVAAAGRLRDDVAPEELAAYCVHALTAAGRLSSQAASTASSPSRWPAYDPRAETEPPATSEPRRGVRQGLCGAGRPAGHRDRPSSTRAAEVRGRAQGDAVADHAAPIVVL